VVAHTSIANTIRITLVSLVLSTVLLAAPTAAVALPPSELANPTWMLDAKVWALEAAGGSVWAGGVFTKYLSPTRSPGATAKGLAAFDPVTGAPAAVQIPDLGSSPSVVDVSLGPDGILYAGGSFTYNFEGKSRRNLVGINPTTGQIVQGFSTPSIKAVLATNDRVYAGGVKLAAYNHDGTKDTGFTDVVPSLDPTIARAHTVNPTIRDLAIADDGDIFAVGQFDFINGGPVAQKSAVKVAPLTGEVRPWKPDIKPESDAFGLSGAVAGDAIYLGIGGSDFVAAYQVSDGTEIWKTDTSGSAQVVRLYEDRLIVGGHFEWIASARGTQCGSNQNPSGTCFYQPRLAAVGLGDGLLDATWTPQICCDYNGVWGLSVVGDMLHVGGQFTKAGGRTQQYFAQFGPAGSEPPVGPLFADDFESGDLSKWTKVTNLAVQSNTVHTGAFATGNPGTIAWAMARLPSAENDVYVRAWLHIDTRDSVQMLRLRTDSGTNVLAMLVLANEKVRLKGIKTGAMVTTADSLSPGWHDLIVHTTISGLTSVAELSVDGTTVATLATDLGASAIGRLEIGNATSGKDYVAFFDDIVVDTTAPVDPPTP
jgi:hypothetical protein